MWMDIQKRKSAFGFMYLVSRNLSCSYLAKNTVSHFISGEIVYSYILFYLLLSRTYSALFLTTFK